MQSSRNLTVSFALVFVLSFAAAAMAQSGRRVQRPAPAPVPTPEPVTTPTKNSRAVGPALTLIVGTERFSGYSDNISLSAHADVFRAFVDRLDDSQAVKVEVASRDMGRGEASKRAKTEKEAYVVWLQLRPENMAPTSVSGNELVIEYWVYAPTTAKTTTSGRTFPQAHRNRGVIVNPRTSSIYGNYQLQQAGREAAERVLSALMGSLPPRTLPT